MIAPVDGTHDPALRSWVEAANAPGAEFPIQNLPFGVWRRRDSRHDPRVGVAIGDRIVDVAAVHHTGLLHGDAATAGDACDAPSLNRLMSLGRPYWLALRRRLSELLRAGRPELDMLAPLAEAELLAPAQVGDFTDFYASIDHATRVGRLFRPDNPLLANYKYVPIAYHGRASSIVPSGTPIVRPCGQTPPAPSQPPTFGPTRQLDYELEAGFYVGPGSLLGQPIAPQEAEAHIFGLCLVNDWSARDIQSWEYQPLGPFLAKSFASSVSPWVVTMEALAPFRVPALARPREDPLPLPYLDWAENAKNGGIDITLEVWLSSGRMRECGMSPVRLSRSHLRDLYWTPAQMLVHHASNGCNLRTGDLIATGTVSGPSDEARGCLLELTVRGAQPLSLPTGETRRFLEDGDEVILCGWCERPGFVRIGLGECRGVVQPAHETREV